MRVHKEECDDVPKNSDARIICEVWHYTQEYGAPPSKSDLAYEIGKSARTEPCIVGAINRGSRAVDRNLNALIRRGLVKHGTQGGYLLTSKGRLFAEQIRTQYGIRLH